LSVDNLEKQQVESEEVFVNHKKINFCLRNDKKETNEPNHQEFGIGGKVKIAERSGIQQNTEIQNGFFGGRLNSQGIVSEDCHVLNFQLNGCPFEQTSQSNPPPNHSTDRMGVSLRDSAQGK
jgi:hypothetical protein